MHLWIIPLLPLAGAAINGLLGKRFSKALVTPSRWALRLLRSPMALWVAAQFMGLPPDQIPHIERYGTWLGAGAFSAEFGIYLDQLSLVMMLVVTGVGFVIHVYSVGYMAHEGGYYRYFAYLNLFMFFMLTLVLANNYLLMFVGWEGVGLASYLLIGFWFLKKSAADAGKKAFITNRVGDFGFLIALFLLIKHFGTLQYDGLWPLISQYPVETAGAGLLTAIGLLMLVGATGKSAQIPLYVWLPDAMEGPTPVSALIHAATMVTAGVYMVARSHLVFNRAPDAADGGGDHRHADRDLRRVHRHRADRHQEGAGLLHHLAARLHVHGLRRGGLRRRNLSPDDARVLQGAAVPGGGLGHSRPGWRAGHAQHGRPAKVSAVHLLVHDRSRPSPLPAYRPLPASSRKTRFCGRPGAAAITCCG